MKTNAHFWSYLAEFFVKWEVFQTDVAEEIKTHFMFSNFFFSKIMPFLDNRKNFVQPARPHNSMAHAHCMVDT